MTTQSPEATNAAPSSVFDSWLNLMIPGQQQNDPKVTALFRPSDRFNGFTMEELIGDLDDQAVSGGVLTKFLYEVRSSFYPAFSLTDDVVHSACQEIATAVGQYPDRFVGSIMLDPREAYGAARHVAIAVDEYGLGSVRVMPSMSLLAANDALCYPLYTAACDRGVPVTINVGIPGPLKPSKYQNPMHVEDVALAFPDLTIVMTHVGNPWVPEVVALLAKYPNLYVMTSGWAPKYIPTELRDFLTSSRGVHKVMWSSDYPIMTLERALREARDWGLDPDTEARFLGLNALAVFGSDATRARAGATAAA